MMMRLEVCGGRKNANSLMKILRVQKTNGGLLSLFCGKWLRQSRKKEGDVINEVISDERMREELSDALIG